MEEFYFGFLSEQFQEEGSEEGTEEPEEEGDAEGEEEERKKEKKKENSGFCVAVFYGTPKAVVIGGKSFFGCTAVLIDTSFMDFTLPALRAHNTLPS